MFDPSRIVFYTRWLSITRHETTDRITAPAPWREVLNPLRYSVTIKPGRPGHRTLNRGGKAQRAWGNFWYGLKARRP